MSPIPTAAPRTTPHRLRIREASHNVVGAEREISSGVAVVASFIEVAGDLSGRPRVPAGASTGRSWSWEPPRLHQGQRHRLSRRWRYTIGRMRSGHRAATFSASDERTTV